MNSMSRPLKIIIPLAALIIGLIIGLSIGNSRVNKEREAAHEKIKEAGKKVAFMQKKMAEGKYETSVSEQQSQAELDKLRSERQALDAQLIKLNGQMQGQELRIKASEEAAVRADKEVREMGRKNKDLDSELKKLTEEKQALQAGLKTAAAEKKTVQAEQEKTAQDLGRCKANNADLGIIAEELVTNYRNKGLGTILLEKEPLTQVKKVELEQLLQQYREEIEKKKINK